MYSGNRKPLAGSTSFTVRLVGGINSPDRKSSGRAHAAEGRARSERGGGERVQIADARSGRRSVWAEPCRRGSEESVAEMGGAGVGGAGTAFQS